MKLTVIVPDAQGQALTIAANDPVQVRSEYNEMVIEIEPATPTGAKLGQGQPAGSARYSVIRGL